MLLASANIGYCSRFPFGYSPCSCFFYLYKNRFLCYNKKVKITMEQVL